MVNTSSNLSLQELKASLIEDLKIRVEDKIRVFFTKVCKRTKLSFSQVTNNTLFLCGRSSQILSFKCLI